MAVILTLDSITRDQQRQRTQMHIDEQLTKPSWAYPIRKRTYNEIRDIMMREYPAIFTMNLLQNTNTQKPFPCPMRVSCMESSIYQRIREALSAYPELKPKTLHSH